MAVTVAWGLLLVVGLVLLLQHAAEVDRRQMDEEDRAFRAKFDLPEGPETLQDHGKPLDNRPDMMNRSRRTENVPEIAKFEGVSRGSSDDSVRAVATDGVRPGGEAGRRAPRP